MEIALDSNVKAVEFNGTDVDSVVFNGVTIWNKSSPITANIVTRQTNFANNTHSIVPTAAELSASQVYSNINRCNVSDDGTINAFYGDDDYIEDGSNGQVMVYIPKFYYKVTPITKSGTYALTEGKWEISDAPQSEFTLHPAFYDASGNEIDYFLYGAFDAVGQNSSGIYGTAYNTTSDKLSSVAGSSMLPTNNITRATSRTMATNRGIGWYQVGVKQTMAIQMLLSVEYGFNSQIGIGQGVVSTSAATYAGRTTGNITSGTQNKTIPVNWRGIENLWGNISNWIDGLNFSNRQPYFCNSYTFIDNTTTDYTEIKFKVPSSNYITALGYDSDNPWVLLPSTSSSTSNPTGSIGDYVSSSTGWQLVRLGGSWNEDSKAGIFYWNCYGASSAAGTVIGARLMYIPTAIT